MFSLGNVFFAFPRKNGRTAVSAVCESASTEVEKRYAYARFFLMGGGAVRIF